MYEHEYDPQHLITTEMFVPRPHPYPPPPTEAFPPQEPDDTRQQWDLDAEFEQLFRPQVPPEPREPPLEHPAAGPLRADRRRRRSRLIPVRRPIVLGGGIAGVTAAVTATVSVLGAMISYDPLRQLASPTAHGMAGLWPLLIYGPWFAGCLSILHAAAHRRQARPAWCAVTLFSGLAMLLCIAHAPHTITAAATAGLPPVSALVGFHLLFHQITLLHPRHAKIPGQRRR